jgi:hypothetical protein
VNGQESWPLAVLAAFGVLGGVALFAPQHVDATGLLSVTAMFWALLLVVIPVHELGHALAGVFVGYRMTLVQVGLGPVLFALRVGSATVQLRAMPLLGIATGIPKVSRRGLRVREWIFVAGGPVASMALSVALHLLLERHIGRPPENSQVRAFVDAAAWMNGWVIAGTLIPIRGKNDFMTDGYRLLTIPFWTKAQMEAMHIFLESRMIVDALAAGETTQALAAAEDLRQRAPQLATTSFPLGFVLLKQGRYEEARAMWREGLAQSNEASYTAALQNNIAFASTLLGRIDDLPEAERFSAAALDALPISPFVKGTRGSVLVRLGRAGEALPLLERALALAENDDQRVDIRVFLARALRILGRLDESEHCVAEARRLDPTHHLLAWATSDAPLAESSVNQAAAESTTRT